jgi:hypothetical protein
LIALWLLLAGILVYIGIVDTLSWQADPDLVRMGLGWSDSYLPHGILAAAAGLALLSVRRSALWCAAVASSLFGLYFAAYLVFGGEGTFLRRVVIPLALLCLTGLTLQYVANGIRQRVQ